MDYGGDTDFKRSKPSRTADSFVRRSADERPRDVDLSLRQADLRSRFDRTLRLVKVPAVWVPSVAAILFGVLLVLATGDDSAAQSVGVGVITTGIALGLFRWGQEIAAASSAEQSVRRQVGMAHDLGFCDLSGAEFPDGYFRSRRLTGAKFSSGIFHNSDFRDAELVDARLTNGEFFRSNFTGANLTGAGLYQAHLQHCTLRSATLVKATLVNADLTEAKLDGTDLTSADLRGANLTRASLIDAKFDDTWYSRSTIWPSYFEPGEEAGLLLAGDSKADKDIDLTNEPIAKHDGSVK